MKMVHAAKCLNTQCDNPVVIPWKENCLLVRKPVVENGQNGHDEENNELVLTNGQERDGVIRCDECGTKYTDKHVEKFVKTMEFTELHLQSMKGASVACILYIKLRGIRLY